MNLKLRLERLCEQRSWARLHFTDGSFVTGRMLRLGHDYVELETYGDDDKPGDRNYSKHLIPIGLIKMVTVESSAFAEMERRRLSFLAQMETQESTSEFD